MANEINFTLGITVTNGAFQSIPVPTQNVSVNQTNPGVGGGVVVVPPGFGMSASYSLSSATATPGMAWLQNVSPNGAVVTVNSSVSGGNVIATLAPGQFAVLPQGGVTGLDLLFTTPTSTATMVVTVLNA